MAKPQKSNKELKKKPLLTLKEKKAAKVARKALPKSHNPLLN